MDENKKLSPEDLRWKELQNFFTELHKQEEENERKLNKIFIDACNKMTQELLMQTEQINEITECYTKIGECKKRIEESEERIRNEFQKLSKVFPKGKIIEDFNLTPEQVNLYL